MGTAARGLSCEQTVRLFEAAFAAVWRRAHVTLGEVTLTAILDRVLHAAAEQYPQLSSLEIQATGLRFEQLHEQATVVRDARLAEAMRFALVEFLRVLGSLTAEILTPALHLELLRVAPKPRDEDAKDHEAKDRKDATS